MNRQSMRLFLCGALVLSMTAPVVVHADNSTTLPMKMRGKDWCESSPASLFPNGKHRNFNIRQAYTITIMSDPSGNGAMTATISKDPSSNVDGSLTEFELHGRGVLRNRSNHKIEFVLSGAHATVPGIFITMRGQASINKDTGAVKKANGTFVYERDNDQNSDPAVQCFGNGTFETKKHEDHPHPDDHGKS